MSAIETGQKERISTCPECKKPIQPVYLTILDRWIIPACYCQVESYRREEEKRQALKKSDRIQQLFANSGLSSRFVSCSFENWVARPGTEKAFAAAYEYSQNMENNLNAGRGLLFFGRPGNGKSHLAAALVRTALALGKTAVIKRVPMLLSFIRANYQDGAFTEEQIMKTLTNVDLLVLDDCGAEKWTRWTEPTLYTIIDERYSWEKALIITTNSDLDDLEQKVGPLAMDRLLEMCEIIENRGTSYRQEKAFRNKAGY